MHFNWYRWRQVGVGSALVRGAQAAAARNGLAALEAAASSLQPRARAVLHRAGYEHAHTRMTHRMYTSI